MESVLGSPRRANTSLSDRLADWEQRVRRDIDGLLADLLKPESAGLADAEIRERADLIADLFLESPPSSPTAPPISAG